MHARLRGPNNLLILHLIKKKEPAFPCLADEIAEPRPDMNIKVTAFTESMKFYYMIVTANLLVFGCATHCLTSFDFLCV